MHRYASYSLSPTHAPTLPPISPKQLTAAAPSLFSYMLIDLESTMDSEIKHKVGAVPCMRRARCPSTQADCAALLYMAASAKCFVHLDERWCVTGTDSC